MRSTTLVRCWSMTSRGSAARLERLREAEHRVDADEQRERHRPREARDAGFRHGILPEGEPRPTPKRGLNVA